MLTTTRKQTTANVLLAMAATALLLLLALAGIVAGQVQNAQVKEDFDHNSGSGITNATSPTEGGNTYSIHLSGGWGILEMEEFHLCTFEFWVRAYGAGPNVDDRLEVIISGKDPGNEIHISMYDPNSGDRTKVTVKDRYNGKTVTETNYAGERIYGQWSKVKISISKTESETDGTGKALSISINGDAAFDEYALMSGEGSTEISERAWKEFKFEVESTNGDVYLSSIAVETTTFSDTYGLTWTAVAMFAALILIVLLIVFRRKKTAKDVQNVGTKITAPLKSEK